MNRRIAIVTVARSDYGLYKPILEEINRNPDLDLQIIAAAAHLSPRFGLTVNQIVADGFDISAAVEMTQNADDPHSINQSIAQGIPGFSQAYQSLKPDILLLLGDRFEMHAAALASVPHLIPIAHIHGGEETSGAIDNVLRHSITKLSHLHFASTQLHADRIIQMGEDPQNVFVSGAPGIDAILNAPIPPFSDLQAKVPGLTEPYILVTFHPVTTEPTEAAHQTQALLQALKSQPLPVLLTMPNADTGGLAVRQAIANIQPDFPQLHAIETLGPLYLTAMKHARAMVGNSSSGIIEAASFNLPVVNIGSRQAGRAQSANVINCDSTQSDIEAAISQAIQSPRVPIQNIYGNGQAAAKIVETLQSVEISPKFIKKSFRMQAIIRGT